MIRTILQDALRRAVADAQASGALPAFEPPEVPLERPARTEHGDWSSGIALQSAKAARMKPREIAEAIVAALGTPEHVAKVELAGPGFINFFLSHSWLTEVVREVQEAGERWGRTQADRPERIQVEFVSANPTGPMHVGNARWASVGDAIGSLLEATGNEVEREFYLNDYGTQIRLFGESVAARYLQHFGRDAEVPEGGYQGEYVAELAARIAAELGDALVDEPVEARNAALRERALEEMVASLRATLDRFGVHYDVWFSERTLHEAGEVDEAVGILKAAGVVDEREGALWLRTTDFGDDKDRVLVPASGPAYFAADIAYWRNKRNRGFERVIYIWGADHHGHVPRMQIAIRALGDDVEAAEFIIGQLVNLMRGGEPARMSKRAGELVTFEELIDEVGVDAARYTFLRQGLDSAMDFDLDLVVKQSQDNPVYYVQYAHARICSIVRHAEAQGIALEPAAGAPLDLLEHDAEAALLRKLWELPEIVEVAARLRAPHRLTRYAEELASLFHSFYRDCRVVTDDAALTQARLHLCRAAQITLRNTLTLLGVSAPERM